MKIFIKTQLFLLLLVFNFVPVFADFSTANRSPLSVQEATSIIEQHQKDAIKNSYFLKLGYAIGAAGLFGVVARTSRLKDTAFGTGLLFSILPTMAAIMSNDRAFSKAIASSAVAAPIIGMLSGLLVHPIVVGKEGLLQNAGFDALKNIANNIDSQRPSQVLAASIGIGSVFLYKVFDPLIGKISDKIVNTTVAANDYMASKLELH